MARLGWLLIGLLTAGPLGAQDDQPPQQPPPVEEPQADQAPDNANAALVTLDDAKINFGSIVQAFVAKRLNAAGYWPLKDKRTGRLLKLALVRVESEKVKAVSSRRYSAPVVLRNVDNNRRLRALFFVDFADEWQVVGMRLLTAPTPKS